MRLYKMEVYKLCHRKIFLLGIFCVIGIMLIFFWLQVGNETAYVDGTTYYGYRAVQVNREITEEFRGELTDEKADKIVEKYGFPKEVKDHYPDYLDGNFLNRFAAEYLSDGYFISWKDYRLATCRKQIADTELGAAAEATGQKIILEYHGGWSAFLELLHFGTMLGCIVIIFGISITFANEGQTNMLSLLFTTKEGKWKDIYAKIAAAYTVAVGVWLGVVFLDGLLCGVVYGFDGLDCFVGITNIWPYLAVARAATVLNVRTFLMISLLRSFIGIVLLCAATIYLSACFRRSFHAVAAAAVHFVLPILVWILLPGSYYLPTYLIRLFNYATTFYLINCSAVFDIYRIWAELAGLAAAGGLFFTIGAYCKYKRTEG